MRLRPLSCCCLLAGLLPAAEPLVIDPGLLRMSGSLDLLAAPTSGIQAEPSRIFDGALLAYEAVELRAERILMRLRAGEQGRALLHELRLEPPEQIGRAHV